jgi:hypothetical protein
MLDGFLSGANLAGICIAIVWDLFFAPRGGGLLPAFAVTLFFPVVDIVGRELAAVFFFLVGVPICMVMGILDLVLSCAACCGC